MFSKIYRKEKSNQKSEIISRYVRETVKRTPSLYLKKKKTCFATRNWTKDEVDEEHQIN